MFDYGLRVGPGRCANGASRLAASAALTPTQTWFWRGGCRKIKGTASDEDLEDVGVKKSQGRCYYDAYGRSIPSKECGESRALKNRWGGQVSGFSP